MPGAPPTYESRVAAALSILGDDGQAWGSHHSASRMWGLGIHGRDQRIEILRPKLLSAARGGVLVHRSTLIPPHHVTVLRGLPVTTPSRTLFDLARSTGPAALGRGITKAIQVRDIPCSLPSLYRVLYDLGGRGRPGTRRFRQALDGRDLDEPPTESVLDEIGRALLRRVPGIRWQVELSDERGYIRRVDGLIDGIGLVLEFDSIFHDDPQQRALDDENDRRLLAHRPPHPPAPVARPHPPRRPHPRRDPPAPGRSGGLRSFCVRKGAASGAFRTRNGAN